MKFYKSTREKQAKSRGISGYEGPMYQLWLLALSASVCIVSAAPTAFGLDPSPLPEASAPAALPAVALPIIDMASQHQDDRPTGTMIDAIIVHDTETPGIRNAATIVNWFRHPRSGVSAHYVIGKRGELVQCVPDERRAWHAGPSRLDGREKVNDFSIGIELVNGQTGRDPFTDAQHRTLALLTADLITRFAIPRTRIVGHRHVTNYPTIKRDPADNFSWARYFTDVDAVLATTQVVRVPVPPASPPPVQAKR